MGKHYYYEVDYRCTCEVCGEPIRGVIRRGPLEYNKGGILPTGMDSAFDAADIALCRKAIRDAVERSDNPYLIASNADHCPHCGARQSWCPLKQPQKPGGIKGYFLAAVGGMLAGSLLGLVLVFFELFDLFFLFIIASGIAGVYLLYRSRRKDQEKDRAAYQKEKQAYDAFRESLSRRKSLNKPEILWETERRAPL